MEQNFFTSLWSKRLELKRSVKGREYIEPNLLIVLASISSCTTSFVLDFLDIIFDVSDVSGISFLGVAYSREHSGGGVTDVECWREVGDWSIEKFGSVLVHRPDTILMLVVDLNLDDPKKVTHVIMSTKAIPTVQTLVVYINETPFPSTRSKVFNVPPPHMWLKTAIADERNLLDALERIIVQQLTGTKSRLLRRAKDSFDGMEFVVCHKQNVQEQMETLNVHAFEKYRRLIKSAEGGSRC